jgi:hypothetical protein
MTLVNHLAVGRYGIGLSCARVFFIFFNHGWTRMNTDWFFDLVFIRVHLCSSVVKTCQSFDDDVAAAQAFGGD